MVAWATTPLAGMVMDPKTHETVWKAAYGDAIHLCMVTTIYRPTLPVIMGSKKKREERKTRERKMVREANMGGLGRLCRLAKYCKARGRSEYVGRTRKTRVGFLRRQTASGTAEVAWFGLAGGLATVRLRDIRLSIMEKKRGRKGVIL